MGYYRSILIDINKKLGPAFKKQGLVMRGEERPGSLHVIFLSTADETWRSPITLDISGGGGKEASWRDVTMYAQQWHKCSVGSSGWTAYVDDHYFQEHHTGDDAAFLKTIRSYFRDMEPAPWNEVERPNILSGKASDVYAAIVNATVDERYTDREVEIDFSRDAKGETLSFIDGHDKVLSFLVKPDRETVLHVNGTPVETFRGDERDFIADRLRCHYAPIERSRRYSR